MRFRSAYRPIGCALAACLLASAGATCNVVPGTSGGPQLVFKGLKPAILSVSGTAANDIYAVGADPNDGLGPYVLHYDGQKWKRLTTGQTGEFWWISVAPIDGAFYLAGSNGKVVKFTPSSNAFDKFTTPGTQTVFGVWGSAANNLWAVGGDDSDPDHGGVVWHFDGTTWSNENLSAVLTNGVPTLYKVWGRAANDVYAVGRLGTILHFDGTNWSKLTSGTTATLFTIHGNAAQTIGVGGFINGTIVEESGGAFSNKATSGIPQVNGVFVPPAGKAVAVGVEAAIVYREDAGWSLQSFSFNTTRDFHAAWIDPDGGIWAVGGDLSVNLSDGIVAYVGNAKIGTEVSQ